MTTEQLQQDIDFLLLRSLKAGSASFGNQNERDYGLSSNSIVAIAYGVIPLEKQYFPSDISDMESCENMWKKLPQHRKTEKVIAAMEMARLSNYWGKKKTI